MKRKPQAPPANDRDRESEPPPPPPPPRDRTNPLVMQWPSTSKAALRLGMSPEKLLRLARNGVVETAKATDGTIRFNPQHLDDLQSTESEPGQSSIELEASQILRASNELLKQSHAHLEELMRLIVEPSRRALELMAAENRRITERCAQLESGRLETIRLAEELQTESHLRDLATKHAQSSEARKQQAFGLLAQHLPGLMTQFGALQPQQREQVNAAIELLSSLHPDQLNVLTQLDGLLTPQQVAAVRRIVGSQATPTTPTETPANDDATAPSQ